MKIADKTPAFSSRGPSRNDLAAPGFDVVSTVPGDSYRSMSGTSMAAPSLPGMAAMLFSSHPGASSKQISGALRHGDFAAILQGKAELGSAEEYLKLDAREMLESAASQGTSVLEELDRRRPVQDEMPLLFENDAARDKYFQGRVDDRAQMAEALKALEAEPGYSGPKTDWSGEKRVDISQLDPAEKAAFYARLDSLNQAYYGKVIAMLT